MGDFMVWAPERHAAVMGRLGALHDALYAWAQSRGVDRSDVDIIGPVFHPNGLRERCGTLWDTRPCWTCAWRRR